MLRYLLLITLFFEIAIITLLLCLLLSGGVNKVFCLDFFLEGYAGRGDVFPIYIGDDRTDEDAFKVRVVPVCINHFRFCTTATWKKSRSMSHELMLLYPFAKNGTIGAAQHGAGHRDPCDQVCKGDHRILLSARACRGTLL
jgi:hypothetical protein